jgi:hypothetical protein
LSQFSPARPPIAIGTGDASRMTAPPAKIASPLITITPSLEVGASTCTRVM